MVDIPEQAVEVAADAAHEELMLMAKQMNVPMEYTQSISVNNYRVMRAALTAASPYMSGVKVKELEWTEVSEPNEDIRYTHITANSSVGQWSIEWKSWKDYDDKTIFLNGYFISNGGDNLEAAKTAAQADYEARILSAIEADPSPRDQALEEAAQNAECHSDDRARRYSMDWNDGYIDGCKGAAAAIRALKSQQNTETSAIEKKKFYHNEWPHDALMAARRDGFIDHNGGEAWRYQFTHKDEKGKYDLLYRDTSNSSIQAALPPAQTGGGDE